MGIVILVVVCIVFLLLTQNSTHDVQDLKHVEIIKTINLYKSGYEHSGFSIGKSGMRSYYRRKNRYVGTDIKFRVTYNSGKTATVTAREGTERCKILLDFIDRQNRPVIKQAAAPTAKVSAPAQGVSKVSKPESQKKEAQEKLVATLSAVSDSKNAQGLAVSETMTAPARAKAPVPQDVYSAGEYKVGVTIPAGEYVIHTKKRGGSYYEVNNKHDILFNGFVKGALLIELRDGDYFEFSDATVQRMEKVDLVGLNLPSCALKVGTHIPPGEYLLTSLNSKANPMAIYKSCRLTDKNLKTFEYVKGNKFVTLKRGEVISYEDCKIELVEEHADKPVSDTKAVKDVSVDPMKAVDSVPQTSSQKKYPSGDYLVGEDLDEGEYIVFSDDGRDTSIKIKGRQQKKERVAFSFTGSCIVKLCQWDKIELGNGYMVLLDEEPYQPKHNQAYMLKVGKHIESGTYELSQVDSSRFAVYYLMNDSMLQFDEALDSDAIFEKTTISVSDGQYIYLENAQLTPLK